MVFSSATARRRSVYANTTTGDVIKRQCLTEMDIEKPFLITSTATIINHTGCGNTDPTIWLSAEFKYPFSHALP
jgi:hypothetical protein